MAATAEVDALCEEIAGAYVAGRLTERAFTLLLASATAMCDQPPLDAPSVLRHREARALDRLREAAESTR